MNTVPVIITTLEGLLEAVQEAPPVIYVDFSLLAHDGQKTHTLLAERTYRKFKVGKHGDFYVRAEIRAIGILDPLDIL